MREVLISIQPKWVEKIVSGEKTVEVRKTRPKIETPFKVYIYCTKDNTFAEKTLRGFDENGKAIYYKANKGKVIGEFVCDRIDYWQYNWNPDVMHIQDMSELSCVSVDDLLKYANYERDTLYAWHITDLVVYDEPKELSQVLNRKQAEKCVNGCEHNGMCQYCKEIRPPQSWCYIEPRQTAD